jgi:hypothetical protein
MSVALGASASASAVVLSHKVALVLTIVMLAFSTGSFAYNAQQRRGYGPLLLCLFAAPLLLSNPVINLLEVRLPPPRFPAPLCALHTRLLPPPAGVPDPATSRPCGSFVTRIST